MKIKNKNLYNITYDLKCIDPNSSTADECLVGYENISDFDDFIVSLGINIPLCGFEEDKFLRNSEFSYSIVCHPVSDPEYVFEFNIDLSDDVISKIKRPLNIEYFHTMEEDTEFVDDSLVGSWETVMKVDTSSDVFYNRYSVESYLMKEMRKVSNYPNNWEQFCK